MSEEDLDMLARIPEVFGSELKRISVSSILRSASEWPSR